MAESLKDRIRADLNQARRDRDRMRTELLSMTLSEIRNREIELGRDLTDEETVGVLTTATKRRREAAEQMRAGGREELAGKEDSEAVLLSAYLPPALTADEIREMVREAIADGATNVGGVMGRIAAKIKGRFDGKEANAIVRQELES